VTHHMRDLIRLVESDDNNQPLSPEMSAHDFFLQVCTLDDGVLRWKSNKSVVHHDMVKIASEIGLPVDIAKCDAARAADKQAYAASKDRIKALTGSTGGQLRDFLTKARDTDTKVH
jgi:hypothetical protein